MKLKNQGVKFIEDFDLVNSKTKELASILKTLGLLTGRTVIVKEVCPKNMMLASRNIPNCSIVTAKDLNIYDCVASDNIVFTLKGLGGLAKRFTESVN